MFKNLHLQTAMNIGNASNTAISGQSYPSSTMIPPPRPPSVVPPIISTTQKSPPPPLSASTPLMPPLDNTIETSNRAANLVKPSTFFAPPPSSSPLTMMPSPSSSMPSAPPVHPPPGNLQRPYGAPLLQPFPPPTPPPPSLTPSNPAPNYGPVISRDQVRDALLLLVQVRSPLMIFGILASINIITNMMYYHKRIWIFNINTTIAFINTYFQHGTIFPKLELFLV